MCWVNVPAASRRPRRAGTSTVAAGVPPCQPRERSRFNNCAGSVTASRPPGTVAIARCQDFRLPSGIAKRNAVRVLGTGKPEDGRPWSSSDGLPDQSQRGDKSGLFWECSALERSASRTGEQRSGRLAKRPKAGRSWRQAGPAPTWPICGASRPSWVEFTPHPGPLPIGWGEGENILDVVTPGGARGTAYPGLFSCRPSGALSEIA